MNAHDQQKAEEAARRRHEDVRDCVIEGIGEVFSRRASRASKPDDKLHDLRIDQRDFMFIARWTEAALETELVTANFDPAEITTVDQLASAIERQLSVTMNAEATP